MGKYIAGILGFIALAWIAYVGINIASFQQSVSPFSAFPARETIVVANRPFNYELISSTGLVAENELARSIFSNPERVQHIYTGSYGKTILLERSKPWTIEIAKQFFHKNNLSAELISSRKLKISNGWFASFDKEFLVLTSTDRELNGDNAVNWNYLDKKSSYSVVKWDEAYPSIENVYQKPNGNIVYVSNENTAGKHLADDQDAFSDVIPADFDSYKFYEKEYLRDLGTADPEFFTWISSGAVVIAYNGNKCIITDFLPSQDPIAILGDKVEESSLNAAKTSGHVLNSNLPKAIFTNQDYYLEVFNNRVYIAENKSVIDELIGVYESGKTLTQNLEKYTDLFSNSPKKVSYREITAARHKTISLLNNSRHTVVQKVAGVRNTDSKKKKTEIEPLRIDGGIEQVLPVQGSDFIYVLSKTGTIYGVNNSSIGWKLSFNGQPVSPLSFTGKNDELLLVTANEVHQIGKNGEDRITTTGRNSEILAAATFSWKGQDQMCIVDRAGIHIITSSGKKSAIAYNFSNSLSEAIVWVNRSELRVSVLNGSQFITFSADKKRKLKEVTVNKPEFLVKTDQGPFVYNLNGQTAQKTNWNGEQFAVLSGAKKIKKQENNKNLLFLSSSSVTATDLNGAVISRIHVQFPDPEAASFIEEPGSKPAIAVLDGIANRNYVFSKNGAKLSSEPFEGSGFIVVQQKKNGKLQLISQANGYLVWYPIR